MAKNNDELLDHLEATLNAAIAFQNRFVQFESVIGLSDEFLDLLNKYPHMRAVYVGFREANDKFVNLVNNQPEILEDD